jgi:eukaryotic-like serine/threonine-protein kinase
MDLSAPKAARIARFGLFEANFEQRLLTKRGLRVKLQDQPFQVLILLLERPGEVVTREEIRQKLWSANTFVEFDDGLNTAIKKLRAALGDSADNPRFVETIPRRGYRFLAPVTLLVPGETGVTTAPQTADIVVATRERSRVVVEQGRSRARLSWASVAIILTLGAIGGSVYWTRHWHDRLTRSTQTREESAIKPRRSVAVLGFRNISGKPEYDWFSVAISEMLNTELSAGGSIRMVSGEDIARTKVELPLTDADSLAKDSLSHLRTNLGTDVVVLGSYTVIPERGGNRIRLDVRLQDTQAGDTIAEQAVTGHDTELFELIASAGSRLRQELALGDLSSEQASQARASLPANPVATRLYSEGLARLRVFDGLAARDLFLRASASDPKFPQVHASLAETWSMLGYDQKAKEESKKAFELASNLSRPDRMWIEGTYREANSEWDKALEIYKMLYEFFPDNLDYGLRLAEVQRARGKPQEALTVLENLHKLPPPSGRDPRIDLSAVKTCVNSGDLKKAQRIIESSAIEAKGRGARLLLAQALRLKASTLLNLGDMDPAIGVAEQARQIYHDTGDKFGEAAALAEIGTGLWYKSDTTKAIEIYRQCLTMNREIGNRIGEANALNYVGSGLALQSDLEGARRAFQQALDIYSEVDSKHDVASTLTLLAWAQSSRGDLQGAKTTYENALRINRAVQDRQNVGNTLEQLGLVVAAQGHLDEADKMEREALQIAQQSGDKVTMTSANRNLGNIAVFRGDAESAKKWLDTASSLAKETGDADALAEIEHWRTLAKVTEGELGPAESSLRGLVSQFRNLHDIPNEIQSGALLVKVLVKRGKNEEAQQQIDSIREVASKAQCFEELLQLRIAGDRLKASTGKTAQAKRDLELTEILAREKGFALESLETRLALGELEVTGASSSVGRSQLAQLEREARARGFGMVARQAATARLQLISKH